jgi:hypothetical protein
MAQLIQICASQNDLFGLDGDGMVYQYNFNTNTWMSIGRGRSDSDGPPRAEEMNLFARPNSHRGTPSEAAPPASHRE